MDTMPDGSSSALPMRKARKTAVRFLGGSLLTRIPSALSGSEDLCLFRFPFAGCFFVSAGTQVQLFWDDSFSS